MRRGGGKSKGNRFENLMAKHLSWWLTADEDSTQLIPTRLSGGWRPGTEATAGWRQVGDLAPNGEQGDAFRQVCCVECKHSRVELLWKLFTAGSKSSGANILTWWDTLYKEASPHQLVPLLLFRTNSRPVMLATLPTVADYIAAKQADEDGSRHLHFHAVTEDLHLGILPLGMLLRIAPDTALTTFAEIGATHYV